MAHTMTLLSLTHLLSTNFTNLLMQGVKYFEFSYFDFDAVDSANKGRECLQVHTAAFLTLNLPGLPLTLTLALALALALTLTRLKSRPRTASTSRTWAA